MSIKDYLAKIDQLITDSGIIENWGGIAVHMTDKDRPYGISLKESCRGNIYGENDLVSSEGYMHINKENSTVIELNKLIKQFEYSIDIELFTSKVLGEVNSKAIEVANFLWNNKYNLVMKNSGVQTTFTLKHRVTLGCNDVVFDNEICGC